jgi:hypothetical protein
MLVHGSLLRLLYSFMSIRSAMVDVVPLLPSTRLVQLWIGRLIVGEERLGCVQWRGCAESRKRRERVDVLCEPGELKWVSEWRGGDADR